MEGEGEIVILGKSIIVPSVQELAKGCVREIPERYIRTDQEPSIVLVGDDEDSENQQVPIISFEALISGDELELQNMHLACQEWGFFQLINHGVSSLLLDKFNSETQDFFYLPLHEKKKYWQTATDMEGFGQAFIVSEDQKLDWADMFYMTTLPKYLRRPNLFPMLPHPYRDTLENYTAELHKLASTILVYMEKSLNIDSELSNYMHGGHQSMRMNYYPPCSEPHKVIGLSPHTDATVLVTILLQLDQMKGLQVKKNNQWVAVHPLPNAFIINLGDAMEIVTNGIYRSVSHRAVVNATKERLTVATFHCPNLDQEIGPMSKLITCSNPARFRRINMLDYWNGFLNHPLDGKRYLDVMRIVKDDEYKK